MFAANALELRPRHAGDPQRGYNAAVKTRAQGRRGVEELRQQLRQRARALRRIAGGAKRYLTPEEIAVATRRSMAKLAVTYEILAEN